MPIGVPKVAYRLPGEATPQWVDLYNRLYRERVLFLGSGLDDELANQLNGIMLYLSAEDSSRSLFLYINSPGGSVTAGLSVFDIMNYVQASVTTIGIGFAASMASFILAGGERGSRIALPHCRVMIHHLYISIYISNYISIYLYIFFFFYNKPYVLHFHTYSQV